jgi:serine protease Do
VIGFCQKLIIFIIILSNTLGVCLPSTVSPTDLALPDGYYWLVLASRKNLDEAIGQARRYEGSKVLFSTNGWYAAVIGPQNFDSGKVSSPALREVIAKRNLPSDTFLSNGKGFSQIAWDPPTPPFITVAEYDGKTDKTIEAGNLHLVMSKVPGKDADTFLPILKAYTGAKPIFEIRFPEETAGTDIPAAKVHTIWLDRSALAPQIIFTYDWKGAHCCVVTAIATESSLNDWRVIQADAIDGWDGYDYEENGSSGESLLVSLDQHFLYAFDSYSASRAPIKIQRLTNGQLVDVTREPWASDRVLQSYFGITPENPSDSDWHSNGFLAGWVASSILVGRGQEAWAKMLANYDRETDFPTKKCLLELTLEKCPDSALQVVPFPLALKQFLIRYGYITSEKVYQVPVDVPSALNSDRAVISQPLQMCSDATDTVRTLVIQTFLRRKLSTGEHYDAFKMRDDTTAESFNRDILEAGCAVTYDADLPEFASNLLSSGQYRDAERIIAFARRAGAKISARVRFLVKPTPKTGQSFVQLLP